MRAQELNWGSPRAQALITAGDVGGLIRWARRERGWRQADLGSAAGYSASAVSRLETGHRRASDLDMVRLFADALFVPAGVLAAVLRVVPLARNTVAFPADGRSETEEDPLKRRSLLRAAAVGITIPTTVLNAFDESLALLPGPTAVPTAARCAEKVHRARALFNTGAHTDLIQSLPDLLATAHACAEQGEPAAYARLAACYDLATEALSKIGRHSASRLTADRSNTFSGLSGSPLAAAASARAFSIVLRHEGRVDTARRITLHAAANVEATGLTSEAQAAAYAQMLCTVAYAAAQAGDRDLALGSIRDAERAASLLPEPPNGKQTFGVTPASVTLYKTGVLWALGDSGAAVHAGSGIRPGQLPTAERRGRLHTDLARAWWQWGKPEQTALALLAAYREAPSEVRDRAGIRSMVAGLVERHPRVGGVRELSALVDGVRG